MGLLYPIYSFGQVQSITQSDSSQEKLAFELAQIYAIDQKIRDSYLLKTYPDESSKIIPVIDSINFDRFITYVKEYGFPTKSSLGKYFHNECVRAVGFVMLLHNPRRLVEDRELYQLFKNEVHNGRLSADNFALSLDKYYVMYKGKSLYNSQFKTQSNLAIKGVSIADKQLSDSLRIDIGLSPLSEDEFINETR